jgi:hypothetical protein
MEAIKAEDEAIVEVLPCPMHPDGEDGVVRLRQAQFRVSMDSKADTRESWVYLSPAALRQLAEQCIVVADGLESLGAVDT